MSPSQRRPERSRSKFGFVVVLVVVVVGSITSIGISAAGVFSSATQAATSDTVGGGDQTSVPVQLGNGGGDQTSVPVQLGNGGGDQTSGPVQLGNGGGDQTSGPVQLGNGGPESSLSPIAVSIARSGSPRYSSNYGVVSASFSASYSGSDGSGVTIDWSGVAGTNSGVSITPTIPCSSLPGTVTATAHDQTGHFGSSSITLDACPTPIAIGVVTGNRSYNANFVQLALAVTSSASGGLAPYVYAWSGANLVYPSSEPTTNLILTCQLYATEITITATDANGQTSRTNVAVAPCPGEIKVSTSSSIVYSGSGSATVSLSSTILGGQGALTLKWIGPQGWTSTQANPTATFACSALPSVVSLYVSDESRHFSSSSVNIPACPAR